LTGAGLFFVPLCRHEAALNLTFKIKTREAHMARSAAWTADRAPVLPKINRWHQLKTLAAMAVRRASGALLLLTCLVLLLALASYNAQDPSLNTATAQAPHNWLGAPGAWVADVLLQWFGLAALALVLPIGALGLQIMQGAGVPHRRPRLWWMLTSVILLITGLALLPWSAPWRPDGSLANSTLAGALGRVISPVFKDLFAAANASDWLWLPSLLLLPLGLAALGFACGLTRYSWLWAAHSLWDALPSLRRSASDIEDDEDDAVEEERPVRVLRQRDPSFEAKPRVVPRSQPRSGVRESKERQRALDLGDSYELPSLELLTVPPKSPNKAMDQAALEKNARFLETVLQDFGVDGRIVEVRPGPVVTLYELEPAPGIKSSRVIGLADDIARSMSAISARVAVVPGRNVIGIELPNKSREVVYLRDLMASESFERNNGPLPLVLGKDISGAPVITDLAPMPHLLIAGSTGSGKSVGLNAMILSLLYRLTPEQCRFIMIDPKMLELSIYDGIPHLLSPVVTEPKKAIVALKWAVREMDERYAKMSKLGVRGIFPFNEKIMEAKGKGKPLMKRVHTGYDRETGQPTYEDQTFDFDVMPLLVVIVDELADLMMVAGKEIEFLIQRLAQKARAAGIHLILATQRPSVDVITGVIKANLPTRVSFAVTSKIDSRTILNEQGAEQLLGKGDALFMIGGKQCTRVHGPLVSEAEVERVADHWRGQGMPDYLDAVTEDPEDDGALPGMETNAEDDLFSRAVQVVVTEGKCSISYIQRQLRVGYNTAARLVEQMEKQGMLSSPDHLGKREILIDNDGLRR
jgi:DNA segregation ATPase FtsK/SpoIIIE, S-DNA-T family